MSTNGRKPVPVIERVFLRCSVAESGCVEWTGAHTGCGYGTILGTGRKFVLVHRAVWEEYIGPIADGLELDHLCRNRLCCRLDHLEPVTKLVNVRRARGWTLDGSVWVCKRGHRMTDENVTVTGDGRSRCRKCRSMAKAAYYMRSSGSADDA